MRTPARTILALPTEALASAIAGEWREQTGSPDPRTMPLNRLAVTVIDRIRPDPARVVEQVLAYAGSDLLCYRAVEPETLARRQAAGWQPWLDWAARRFDAPLLVASGVVPITQPAQALEALRHAVAALDAHALMALAEVTALAGSCVLGLAAVAGEIDAGRVFELSQIDETFQMERWGADDEAVTRRAGLAADLGHALRYLALARG